MPQYSSARIPKPLFEEIEKLLKENPELGYRSVSELVNDLLRKELGKSRKP
ncbi:MAG: ribbon-helix-helix domain-containing protein [Thermoplasmataceae archaeon]